MTALTNDPNPINNSDNVDLSVIGLADLVVSKTGLPLRLPGAIVTYTVVVDEPRTDRSFPATSRTHCRAASRSSMRRSPRRWVA
ncbi:MAG: hypothetical protein IPM07_21355 [Anaerolineales bacterium]|nr:hypothetical protein [Anaerolineales bacterium]